MVSPTQLGRRGLLFGKPPAVDETPARPLATIAPACLAFRGIACMSCRDACGTGAIRFSLVRGGAIPRVEADACTGCAECISVCPASAITITPPVAGEAHDA